MTLPETPDEAMGPRADRASLSMEAATYLRQAIFTNKYEPGDFIRIDRVANQLQMSATPVREALAMLASQGYVSIEPHRGFVVQRVALADITDVFVLRAFLAGELTARATGNLTDDELGTIVRHHEAFIKAAKDPSRVRDLETLNVRFHQAIYLAGRSPRLMRFQDLALLYAPAGVYPKVKGWVENSITEHTAIVEALQARRKAEARRSMERHIRSSGDLVCRYLNAQDAPPADD